MLINIPSIRLSKINIMSSGKNLFWFVFVIAACVLVAPLFTIEVPPLVDYPNHLARLYVIADGASDPWLSHKGLSLWFRWHRIWF